MKDNRLIYIFAAILIVLPSNVFHTFGQTPEEIFSKGLKMTDTAQKNDDFQSFEDGLKLMETAQKKDKERADWCYEIGSHYYYYVSFGNKALSFNREKGLKWFEKGAKLGDLKSALVLYSHYKPEAEPYSILSPEKEWKQYFKERDKCYIYAGIALTAKIPANFDDYNTLADAASFTNNRDLAIRYAAKAADNEELLSLETLINDERAFDYLTSPKAMYEAAKAIWNRNRNDIWRNDIANGLLFCEKSAELGYPLAQLQMGYIYLTGITSKQVNVKPDTLKAVSWYKLAAKNKEPEAISELGRLYINGKGIEKDIKQGFMLLNESDASGWPNSKLYLGYCYLYGIGTNRDTKQARKYFQTYFDSLNHTPGNRLIIVDRRVVDLDYLVGLSYFYENSPECVALLEASLKNKTYNKSQRSDTLRKLAQCYKTGFNGIPIDIDKANNLFEKSLYYGGTSIERETILL